MTTYSEKTVEFLWSLRLNNSREWFQAHKAEYEALMHRPTKELADALFEHLRGKYPKHDWNLHISRIYRDARRLYGRGPMNDHLWFTLWADREEGGEGKRSFVMRDLRLFLNSVTRSLELMKQGGVAADMERRETPDALILTISIPKGRSL